MADALLEDARIWRDGIELMIGDLAGGELLPGRILLCGGGADLPQVGAVLDEDGWWSGCRSPAAEGARAGPDEVIGLRDATGSLGTRQDVTPMALAHQALILDAGASAVDRAMRGVVREMAAVSDDATLLYLEADDEVTSVVRRLRATEPSASCWSRPAARGRRRARSRCGCLRAPARRQGRGSRSRRRRADPLAGGGGRPRDLRQRRRCPHRRGPVVGRHAAPQRHDPRRPRRAGRPTPSSRRSRRASAGPNRRPHARSARRRRCPRASRRPIAPARRIRAATLVGGVISRPCC